MTLRIKVYPSPDPEHQQRIFSFNTDRPHLHFPAARTSSQVFQLLALKLRSASIADPASNSGYSRSSGFGVRDAAVIVDWDTPVPVWQLPFVVGLVLDQRCWCRAEPAVSKLCLIAADAQMDVRGNEIARRVSTLDAISGTGTKYCITEHIAKKR